MGNDGSKLTDADLKMAGLSSGATLDNPGGFFVRDSRSSVSLEDFDLISVIGKGSFGKVFLVRKKDSGKTYAMKVIKKSLIFEKDQLEHTRAERDILQLVEHAFLVGLRYAFQTEEKLYMCTELIRGGELFFHLKKSGRFNEARARLYSAEILLALAHLHSLDIIYRDLKPENILLDEQGHVRLTDFGLCKRIAHEKATTFCGTPEYLAPEVLLGGEAGHGKPVDWWSLGTLLYEMLVGLPPFYDENHDRMYRKILHAPIDYPKYLGANAIDLLTKLLDRNAATRLGSGPTGAEEIKSHPFFASLNWADVEAKRTKPEFIPTVKSEADFANFDKEFTAEKPEDSVVTDAPLSQSKKDAFRGFTFVPETKMTASNAQDKQQAGEQKSKK